MSHLTLNTEFAEALERFQISLETPLISGEMESWADCVRSAYRDLASVLHEHVREVHRPMIKQISTEDPELLCHIAGIEQADSSNLDAFDRLGQRIEQLPGLVAKIEPDEKRLEDHLSRLIQEGLELAMQLHKQETVISTWHDEALFRDRGTID